MANIKKKPAQMRMKGIRNYFDCAYCIIPVKSPAFILFCKGVFDPIAKIVEYRDSAKLELEVSKEVLYAVKFIFYGQLDVVSFVIEKIGTINTSDIIIVFIILL